jgi:allantoin racemase
MPIRIRVVTPHVAPVAAKLREIEDLAEGGALQLSQVNIADGPRAIESPAYEHRCLPGVLARIEEAEAQGLDAVVVDCFADPGVAAARERVAMPVIGPGEASLHLAATLGRRLAIVTVLESVRPMIDALAERTALGPRLAPLRVVDTAVRELDADPERLLARLTEAAARAVRDDGADAIVLGCTGFLGVSDALARALAAQGLVVPVIHPLRSAVLLAATQVRLGLRHRAAGPAR